MARVIYYRHGGFVRGHAKMHGPPDSSKQESVGAHPDAAAAGPEHANQHSRYSAVCPTQIGPPGLTVVGTQSASISAVGGVQLYGPSPAHLTGSSSSLPHPAVATATARMSHLIALHGSTGEQDQPLPKE